MPPCTIVPPRHCELALKRAGLTAADLDLVEINEAFAAVALWSARLARHRRHDKVNVTAEPWPSAIPSEPPGPASWSP